MPTNTSTTSTTRRPTSEAACTLPVRFTAPQKAILEELSQKSGRTMTTIVRAAVREYIETKAKRQWPTPLPKPKRPPPAPIPRLPRRAFGEHVRSFLALVVRLYARRDAMTSADWLPLLAEYRALKTAGPKQVSAYWHKMNTHRSLVEAGEALPGVEAAEARILWALNAYENMRNQFGERNPVDRETLPPDELRALKASDRKRAQKYREKKRREKPEREAAALVAKGYEFDPESGDVTFPSSGSNDEESLYAAAE